MDNSPTIRGTLLILITVRVGLMPAALWADQAHYVSPVGANIAPYDTWPNAATNIQAAVDEALLSGYPTIVTDGTYFVSSPVTVSAPVRLTSVHGASATFIDGGNSSACLLGVNTGAVIEGFTLLHGLSTYGGVHLYNGAVARTCVIRDNVGNYDGGVLVENSGGVEDSVISGNVATNASANGGGGVCLWQGGSLLRSTVVSNSSVNVGGGVLCYIGGLVQDCVISHNRSTAQSGGGVMLAFAGGVVSNCTVGGNTARLFGGGIHSFQGGQVLSCVVTGNVVGLAAGGISLYEGGLAQNCLLAYNYSSNIGGAVTFSSFNGAASELRNCTIVSNRCATNGGGIAINIQGATSSVYNCIVYFNEKKNGTSDNYQDDTGLLKYYRTCTTPAHTGTVNITGNPNFANLTASDFRILSNSPCIDAGTNMSQVVTDLNGVARPLDGDSNGVAVTDMGAYEYIHPNVDTDHDGIPDAWEAANGLSAVVSNSLVDTDGDGLDNLSEYIAATSPTNPSDYFEIAAVTNSAANTTNVVITWSATTGRQYSVFSCTNLAAPTWVTNAYHVSGVVGTMSYTNTDGRPTKNFKLTVRKP